MCDSDKKNCCNNLGPKDRLTAIENLAKAARGRFENRREIEWKICFGVWTGFAVMAGAALNAKEWEPDLALGIGAVMVTLLIFFGFCVWTCVRRRAGQFDLRTSYYWESVVGEMVRERLPSTLTQKGWERKKGSDEDEPMVEPIEMYDCLDCLKCRNWLGEHTIPQVLTTVAFGVVFVVAVWCKVKMN